MCDVRLRGSEQALPAQGGFGDALLAGFERSLNEIIRKVGIPQAVSLSGTESNVLAQIQEQMAALMQKNAELEARLNGRTLGPEPGEPVEELTEAELTAPPPSAPAPAPVRRL